MDQFGKISGIRDTGHPLISGVPDAGESQFSGVRDTGESFFDSSLIFSNFKLLLQLLKQYSIKNHCESFIYYEKTFGS